jgi:hypothetical protein
VAIVAPRAQLSEEDERSIRAGREHVDDAVLVPVDGHELRACAGRRQAGEEILRAPRLIESLRIAIGCDAAHLVLARLHLIPQVLIHDSQRRNVGSHPIRWRVRSRHTLAGVGILDVSEAIPHESPDVQLVVQDARAAGRIAVNGA